MGARLTSISNFTAFTGLEAIRFYGNSLSTFSMSGSFPNLTSLTIPNNLLTSVDISNLNALTGLALGQNPLMNVNIINNTNLNDFSISDAQLTETSINNMLVNLDNSGVLNGYCNLTGGTNAAPTGAGITAKNNLIAKSWEVFTN